MTPEQRAQRKQAREDAERQRIREAGAAKARELVAERGPIPEQVLREVIRPALVEATAAMRAYRSKRHPA
ncbi:MAG TPA: hypothetical protein VG502_00930 [Flexivirga sp.]|uniref:hypothetical protein n=1 Tax=Flexivirga sp. TaxID=1962927 RepID=UPI002BB5C578|nr:hypothetical protein [Flexivirga sp.]HWC20837.1 hypothetical protein [Flexivirga sp.]